MVADGLLLLLSLTTIVCLWAINHIIIQSVYQYEHPEDFVHSIVNFNDEIGLTGILMAHYWSRSKQFNSNERFLISTPNSQMDIKGEIWSTGNGLHYFIAYSSEHFLSFEFITSFNNDITLTTNNSRDSQLMPHPDTQLVQSFDVGSIDELWEHHLHAIEHLENNHTIRPYKISHPTACLIKDSFIKHAQYIQCIPFWYAKGFYWFFFRRHFLHNRPIEETFRGTFRS